MKKYIGKKVLVNTGWFTANDGRMYQAVWGTLHGVHNSKDVIGFDTSRGHSNWVYEIGNMMIMGCKISLVSLCPTTPDFEEVRHVSYDNTSEVKIFNKPNEIWIAE